MHVRQGERLRLRRLLWRAQPPRLHRRHKPPRLLAAAQGRMHAGTGATLALFPAGSAVWARGSVSGCGGGCAWRGASGCGTLAQRPSSEGLEVGEALAAAGAEVWARAQWFGLVAGDRGGVDLEHRAGAQAEGHGADGRGRGPGRRAPPSRRRVRGGRSPGRVAARRATTGTTEPVDSGRYRSFRCNDRSTNRRQLRRSGPRHSLRRRTDGPSDRPAPIQHRIRSTHAALQRRARRTSPHLLFWMRVRQSPDV